MSSVDVKGVVIVRVSLVLATAVVLSTASACGQVAEECSGNCNQPAAHWTKASVTNAALAFNYAPMVNGHLRKVACRITGRFPGHEAKAVCKGVFTAPSGLARRVVVAFALNGNAAVNPDCSVHWKTSPYCMGKNRPRTTSGE